MSLSVNGHTDGRQLESHPISSLRAFGSGELKIKSREHSSTASLPGLEVIKPEHILRLKIKCNDWLLADSCPQAANHSALF